MNYPVLHTKRLTLRGPEEGDLAPFTEFVTSSKRLAHLEGNGTTNEAWRGFIAGIGHWVMRGYGFFTVVETATDTPVGRTGILNHVGWPEPELAYHMFDNGEGKGFAFESCVAARQWAGAKVGLGPLISIIAPDNKRSIALAERLGAVAECETTHNGSNVIIYRHLAHDAPEAWEQVAA